MILKTNNGIISLTSKINSNMNELPQDGHRGPMRFLVFSASLRKDSFNARLAKLAAGVIEKNGSKVDFASMSEFDCPPIIRIWIRRPFSLMVHKNCVNEY